MANEPRKFENGIELVDSAADAPMNVTERSAAPSSPTTNDVYMDDGSNTGSGGPGWRRYTGAVWEDVSAAAVPSGGILWQLECYTTNARHHGWEPIGGGDAHIPAVPAAYIDAGDTRVEGLAFDDTTKEGAFIGTLQVPTGATSIEIRTIARAETAAAKTATLRFAYRRVGNGDPEAWAAGGEKLYVTVGATTWYYGDSTGVDTLASHGLAANRSYQMQVYRDPDDGSDDMVDDLQVSNVSIWIT